jgi:FtsZ-interacting cell division protein ZipA
MKLGLVLVIVGGVVGIACVLILLIVFILWKSKPERLNHNMDRSAAHKFSDKSNLNASKSSIFMLIILFIIIAVY